MGLKTAATIEQYYNYKLTQIQERSELLNKVVQRVLNRQQETIQSWRSALQGAENSRNPNREALSRVYNEIRLDDDIYSAWRNRKSFVLNKIENGQLHLYNGKGELDEELTMQLHRDGWLKAYTEAVLETEAEGTTVILLDALPSGKRGVSITRLPFHYIDPLLGQVLLDGTSSGQRVSYLEGDAAQWVVQVGDPYNMGFLNVCAPYALRKKLAANLWAIYQELFTIPIMIGKTNAHDDQRKKDFEFAMQNVQTAAYFILDGEESIDFLDSSRAVGGNQVFDAAIERNGNAIKKVIAGQTMTSDDGASLSQAQVHAGIFDGIVTSDAYLVQSVFNAQVLPKLSKFGYKVTPEHYAQIYMYDHLQPNQMQQVPFKIAREQLKRQYNLDLDAFQPEEMAAHNARSTAIADIQQRVSEGKLSPAAAKSNLKLNFELSEADANSLLDGLENSAVNFRGGQQ